VALAWGAVRVLVGKRLSVVSPVLAMEAGLGLLRSKGLHATSVYPAGNVAQTPLQQATHGYKSGRQTTAQGPL